MKILLLNVPFSTPVSPSYSIAKLYSIIKENFDKGTEIKVLDLNAKFHKKRYKDYYTKFNKILNNKFDSEEYDKLSREFKKIITEETSRINKEIVEDFRKNTKTSEIIEEFIKAILEKKPDMIVMSVVYSSQGIIATEIARRLKDIIIVTGGPGVNEKLKEHSLFFENYSEFIKHFTKKEINNIIPDYSIFDGEDYLTTELIIPIKTSESCYYKRCSFCTHHHNEKYSEYNIENIEEEINTHIKNGFNKFFIVDDAIPKKRLELLSEIFKKNNSEWMCQLRAQTDFNDDFLKLLNDSGLKVVLWGIESGNDRILKLMRKGTTVKTNEQLLELSNKNNILNVTFMMFGFPTESKDEFIDSIEFIKRNSKYIDLVSTSIFGLQKNSPVYREPNCFDITEIRETKRTLLDSSIQYTVSTGMSQEEANQMRKKYKRSIEKINKCPKEMNFFREHMLLIR